MKSLQEYWDATFQRPDLKPEYDLWLDKYLNQILEVQGEMIVDLGCGTGNNSLYLAKRGIKGVACDISGEALKIIKRFIPDVETKCFDMTNGLPFASNSVAVLIADLSLHYFSAEITEKVLDEIYRVLKDEGLFLCRLNSTREIENKDQVKGTDDGYLFENEGIYRRFFDQDEIERFFKRTQWRFLHIEEYVAIRYGKGKYLWEIAMEKKDTHSPSDMLPLR